MIHSTSSTLYIIYSSLYGLCFIITTIILLSTWCWWHGRQVELTVDWTDVACEFDLTTQLWCYAIEPFHPLFSQKKSNKNLCID